MGTLLRKASPWVVLIFALWLASTPAAPPPLKIPSKLKHGKTPGKFPSPGMPGAPKLGVGPNGNGTGSNFGGSGSSKLLPPRPVARPVDNDHTNEHGGVTGEAAKEAPLTGCKLPVEAFLKLPMISQVRVGADGFTYFLSNPTGLMQLYRTRGAGTPAERIAELKEGIRRYELGSTAKTVALSTDVGGDEQYDLWTASLVGATEAREPKPLWVSRDIRVQSFRWLDDQKLVATANPRNGVDMDIFEVPLDGSAPKQLAALVGMNEITDVSPDKRHVALERFRSALSSQVLLWEAGTGKVAEIAGVASDDPATVSRNSDGKFAGDGKSLVWVSDSDGEFLQIYQTALPPDGKPIALTREKGDVEWVRWSRERKTMLAAVNIEGSTQLRAFRPDKKGTLKTVAAPNFGEAVVASADADEGEALTVTGIVSSFAMPPRLARWRAGKTTYFTGGEDIPDVCRTRMTRVRYPSFDGLSIPGFLAKPTLARGDKKAPMPFLVYVHGGPEAQFRPEFQRSLAYLASTGIGVFAPNVRGSTGYGKKFTRLDDYKLRMDSVKDVVAGTQWLQKSGHGEAGRLAIYGGSYGGFLVLRTIEVEPDLFAAASGAVGISDFVSFLKGTKSYRRELREREYGPLTDELFLRSISPMTYVDRIRTPLLLFHGARDPRVPVEESQRITEQLKGLGRTVELKVFPDAGHGSHRVDQQIDQTRQLGTFLERWLLQRKK